MAVGRDVENGADVNLEGHAVDQCLFKLLSGLEAQVAAVYVVGEGEGELAAVEVGGRDAFVEGGEGLLLSVQFVVGDPLEHELVGENLVVVDLQTVLVEQKLEVVAWLGCFVA